MHVAAKIGIVAGTVGAGIAAGVVVPKLAGGIEPSTGSGLALTATGASAAGLFGASLRRGAPNPLIGLVGLGAGAAIATLGMQQLFAERPSMPKVQYNPADHVTGTPTPPSTLSPFRDEPSTPSPSPGPAPSPTSSPTERATVEEEVETYGPDGEWLGTEHGTVEVR